MLLLTVGPVISTLAKPEMPLIFMLLQFFMTKAPAAVSAVLEVAEAETGKLPEVNELPELSSELLPPSI